MSGAKAFHRVRGWLAVRHSLPAELLVVVALYAVYESTRGVVAGRRAIALRHAGDVVSIERSLHVFVEVLLRGARLRADHGVRGFDQLPAAAKISS